MKNFILVAILVVTHFFAMAQQVISSGYNIPNTHGGFKIAKTQSDSYLILFADNANRNEGHLILKTNCTGQPDTMVNLHNAISPNTTFTDWYYNPITDSLFILGFGAQDFNGSFQEIFVVKTTSDLEINAGNIVQLPLMPSYINFVPPTTGNSQIIFNENKFYIFASEQSGNQFNTWDIVMRSFDSHLNPIDTAIINLYAYDNIIEIEKIQTGFYLNIYSHTGGTGVAKIDTTGTVLWNTGDIFDIVGDRAGNICAGQNDTLYIAKLMPTGAGDNGIIRVSPNNGAFVDTLSWGYPNKTEIITDLAYLPAAQQLMLINTIDYVPDGEIFTFAYNPNTQPAGETLALPNTNPANQNRMYKLLPANNTGTAFAITGIITNINQPFLYAQTDLPNLTVTANGNSTPQSICQGDSILLSASGGYANYIWNNNATSQSIWAKTSGTYTVQAYNSGSCIINSNELIVVANQLPNANINATPTTCGLNNGNATATGGSTYLWNTGQTSPAINNLPAGDYTVTVTNDNGCSAQQSATINGSLPFSISLPADTTLTEGQNLDISAPNNEAYTYVWNTGESTPNIIVNSSGIYSVTVSNAEGCAASDEITVSFVVGIPPHANNNNSTPQLHAYPNPTSSHVTLAWTNNAAQQPSKPTVWLLTDSYGRILQQLYVQNYPQNIDLSDYSTGIYWLINKNSTQLAALKIRKMP